MTQKTIDVAPAAGEGSARRDVNGSVCSCDFNEAADHDRMLGLVDDPALLRDIISALAVLGDGERDPANVGLFDIEKFVGQHNWTDPVAAYWTAVHIADIMRHFRHSEEMAEKLKAARVAELGRAVG